LIDVNANSLMNHAFILS